MGNAVACIFFRILRCVQHIEDVPEATTLLSLGRLPRSKILAGLYLDGTSNRKPWYSGIGDIKLCCKEIDDGKACFVVQEFEVFKWYDGQEDKKKRFNVSTGLFLSRGYVVMK